ncbi:hypothetical protein OEA41_006817 [Lepraria neglecta]|uniref:Uncharacterized protein n=1 Tax=Lepraria neglecta TaxID=209136 RepID=A0AAE0DNE6_9LECA|nr:hypothetical protein OEA41_006817 [Lepraria neglecta]
MSGKTSSAYFLPCHYFDYIARTASGGIIAIMLGRLRMTFEEAMIEYEKLCHEAFDRPESTLKRSLVKYNGVAKIHKPDEIICDVTPQVNEVEGSDKAVDLLSVSGGFANGINSGIEEFSIDGVHSKVLAYLTKKNPRYHRLDVSESVRNVKNNEWLPRAKRANSNRIEYVAIEYVAKDYLMASVPDCAEYHIGKIARMLVEKEKSRADAMKWERWATGMVYECPECPGADIRYEDRDKLLDHLRSAYFRDLTDGVRRDATH